MSSFEEQGQAFWKWLENNGATLNSDIAIQDYRSEGAGRGVIATKDIKVVKFIYIFEKKKTEQIIYIGRRPFIFVA